MALLDWFRRARRRESSKACRYCRASLPGRARFCFMCGREAPITDGELRMAEPTGALSQLRDRLAHAIDGRYLVQDLLGAGAMGAVFLADDLALERPVAIKVLPPEVSGDTALVERFKREAKTAAKLDHPHIIPIHRVESEAGLNYFVMKYVAGRTLESVLAEQSPIPLDVAMRVLREAAAALGHAHKHGVVHRDVKPANIMLDADDRVVLTDFGISRISTTDATAKRLTSVGTVVGTPHYMAPEQALGELVDGRADQYALAVVGFEMLSGRVPFDDETPHAIIHRHINDAPPRLVTLCPDLPLHIGSAIARALSKAPSRRFDSMQAFAAALDGAPAAGSATVLAGPRTLGAAAATKVLRGTNPLLRFNPRQRRIVAVAGALVILLASSVAGVTGWVHSVGYATARAQVGRLLGAAPGARAAAERHTRVAELKITSKPRATVVIDGVRAGETPFADYRLVVGRTYRVLVQRKGYRPKRETITPARAGLVVRRYVLSPEGR